MTSRFKPQGCLRFNISELLDFFTFADDRLKYKGAQNLVMKSLTHRIIEFLRLLTRGSPKTHRLDSPSKAKFASSQAA